MTPTLSIEVLEIEPEAVYQGTIYDQTVVGKSYDGDIINLFDLPTPVVTEEMVGGKIDVHVELNVDLSNISTTNENKGISQPPDPSTKWSYDFVGEVCEINSQNQSIVLDVGHGMVVVSSYECGIGEWMAKSDTAMGSRLYVPDCRADIIEVVDS